MLGHVISLLGSGSARGGLVSLLLVGQPALAARLEARGIEAAARCSLRPLRLAEVGAYIAHRSREAGREAAELFSSAAVKRIARLSGGVPRFVNLLCREALAAAERRGPNASRPTIVDAVAEDPDSPGSRGTAGRPTCAACPPFEPFHCVMCPGLGWP
jgi:type II secretory pathway predicted ATPase ExeA